MQVASLVEAECAAWQAGFDAMGGTGWSACSDTRLDPCACSTEKNKKEVACDGAGEHITGVALNYVGAIGALFPTAWSGLSLLTSLSMAGVDFGRATLPAWLGSLTALKVLKCERCELSGTLPASYASLTKLQQIGLQRNELDGTLPPGWSKMTVLRYFLAEQNRFTGSLPDEWSMLTKMSQLSFHSNQLTGSIPASWAGWTALVTFKMENNLLSGQVPTGLGATLATLQYTCSLGGNRLRCPLAEGLASKCKATCCEADEFSVPPDSECNTCPANAAAIDATPGADCLVCDCGYPVCAAGKFLRLATSAPAAVVSAECVGCARGQFSGAVGATSANTCQSCKTVTANARPDSAPNSTSSADCVDVYRPACGAGYSAVQSLAAKCEPCPRGRFKAGINSDPCEVCPCGQWQGTAGSSKCDASCPAGTYGNASSGGCDACPVTGYFCIDSLLRPLSAAARCAPGRYEVRAPGPSGDRLCADCAPGAFAAAENAVRCAPCPGGKYQAAPRATFCVACEVGKSGDAGRNATREALQCAACAPGRYQAGTAGAACTACEAGRHQDKTAQSSCAGCVPGWWSAMGAPRCEACAAGRFGNASVVQSAAAYCAACAGGRFQALGGQTACNKHTVCAAGERQLAAPGAMTDRTCAPCPAGAYQSRPGQAACVPCARGQYSGGEGETVCKLCGVGKFGKGEVGATSAASHCEACAGGHFNGNLGASSCAPCARCPTGAVRSSCGSASPGTCIECAAGTFHDVREGACKACPGGTFQSASGATSCESCAARACAAGAYRSACAGPSAGTCIECGAGTFKAAAAAGCAKCPAGQFQNESGKAQCTPCESLLCAGGGHRKSCGGASPGYCGACSPGTFADPAAGVGQCTPCRAGTFSAGENAARCTPCPKGQFQPAVGRAFCSPHRVCGIGAYETHPPGAASDRDCAECEAGTFSNASNLAACLACAAGEFQPEAARSQCSKHTVCQKGQREVRTPSATSDRGCAECAAGMFSDEENARSCRRCAPCGNGIRTDCGAAFEGVCVACAAGRFLDESTSACTACRGGHWCLGGHELPCGGANLFCPPSSSTPSSVAVGHYSLPTGAPEDQRVSQAPCEEGYTCTRGIRQPCPEGRVCQLTSTARVFDPSANASGAAAEEVLVTLQARCGDGEYVHRGACIPCPPFGVRCEDGRVRLLDDFWFDPLHGSVGEFWGRRHRGELPNATGIYYCSEGACRANRTSQRPSCTEGRYGLLCGVCGEGYYATNQLECKKCASAPAAVQIVVAVLIVLLLLLLAARAKRFIQKKKPELMASISEKLPEVLKLMCGLMQILAGFETILYRV
eukprot:g3421.t1